MTDDKKPTTTEMTQQDTLRGPCAICQGKWSEHQRDDIHHIFTKDPNELVTKEEDAKRKKGPQQGALPQSQQRVFLPPQSDSGMVSRLVEMLLAKKLLTSDEALYVAGMGPHPGNSPVDVSRFRDPV